LKKYLENNKDSEEIFINFDNFKKELRQVFGIFNKKEIAE